MLGDGELAGVILAVLHRIPATMSSLTQVRLNLRLWKLHLRGSLYIPEESRHLVGLLASGGPTRLIEEVEKMAKLGSLWASATLGYLSLLPGEDGRRNPQRAIELLRERAISSDPYVLFVLAWAYVLSGRRLVGLRTMRKASRSGFPPAALEFATFVWNGWGIKEYHSAAALDLLRDARKAGHKAALIWKCKMYLSGKFGAFRACLGYLMLPYAQFRFFVWAILDPFSCRVFWFQPPAAGPIFRNP